MAAGILCRQLSRRRRSQRHKHLFARTIDAIHIGAVAMAPCYRRRLSGCRGACSNSGWAVCRAGNGGMCRDGCFFAIWAEAILHGAMAVAVAVRFLRLDNGKPYGKQGSNDGTSKHGR